jgi:hypothetical protein
MLFHPHLHVLLTAGGLSPDGFRFLNKSASSFLFPVKVLSRLFRGLFLDILSRTTQLPENLKSSLYQQEFFCYMQDTLGHTDHVVKYLARYANRVCISDNRILSYDQIRNTVSFSYKDNKDGGKLKTMTLSTIEFMRRFLLHVLPTRFMKIRHYGLLNNRGKKERIRRCWHLLHARFPDLLQDFTKPFAFRCPKCGRIVPSPIHVCAAGLPLVLLC